MVFCGDEDQAKFRVIKECQWYFYNRLGEKVYPGGNRGRKLSRLDVFKEMFPPRQLVLMVVLMNKELAEKKHKDKCESELLKFFGVMILLTQMRIRERRTAWDSGCFNNWKYMPRPPLQKSGMPRWQYDQIWSCIRFLDQPKVRPEGISHAQHRWMLIEDFVCNFNSQKADNFVP